MRILLANLPADADAGAVTAFLAGHGMADATDVTFVPGSGSEPAATFELPVSAAVAETVALHLSGKAWQGHVLRATVFVTPAGD